MDGISPHSIGLRPLPGLLPYTSINNIKHQNIKTSKHQKCKNTQNINAGQGRLVFFFYCTMLAFFYATISEGALSDVAPRPSLVIVRVAAEICSQVVVWIPLKEKSCFDLLYRQNPSWIIDERQKSI